MVSTGACLGASGRQSTGHQQILRLRCLHRKTNVTLSFRTGIILNPIPNPNPTQPLTNATRSFSYILPLLILSLKQFHIPHQSCPVSHSHPHILTHPLNLRVFCCLTLSLSYTLSQYPSVRGKTLFRSKDRLFLTKSVIDACFDLDKFKVPTIHPLTMHSLNPL